MTWSAACALVVLAAGGVALWRPLLERWYLLRLESEDLETRDKAILGLIGLRSERAAPRICEIALRRLRERRIEEALKQSNGYLTQELTRILSTEKPSGRWLLAMNAIPPFEADIAQVGPAIQSAEVRVELERMREPPQFSSQELRYYRDSLDLGVARMMERLHRERGRHSSSALVESQRMRRE